MEVVKRPPLAMHQTYTIYNAAWLKKIHQFAKLQTIRMEGFDPGQVVININSILPPVGNNTVRYILYLLYIQFFGFY
jgi:hypothetical protein